MFFFSRSNNILFYVDLASSQWSGCLHVIRLVQGTYEYGKQLLQAGLVLRRSLRYNLAPNNERSYRLEEAWKRFSQGTNERANRLTVSAMFLASADKVCIAFISHLM